MWTLLTPAVPFWLCRSLYELNFMEAKPARGFYRLTVSVTPKKADSRLIGTSGAEVSKCRQVFICWQAKQTQLTSRYQAWGLPIVRPALANMAWLSYWLYVCVCVHECFKKVCFVMGFVLQFGEIRHKRVHSSDYYFRFYHTVEVLAKKTCLCVCVHR